MQNNNSKINTVLLLVLIILVVFGIILIAVKTDRPKDDAFIPLTSNEEVVGTHEVPTGPFLTEEAYIPPAPIQNSTSSNQAGSYTFAPLTTTYITAQNWPPKVSMLSEPYNCPGIPGPRTINGKMYCVDMKAQRASGSIFTDFTYSTDTTQITFTLRFSQCTNYDGAQKNACEIERAKFNPDQIIINAHI